MAGLLLAGGAAAQQAASPDRVGPSFPCPAPQDPLGQLICASTTLSRRDLEFVQTYQALRQRSTPAQQAELRTEAGEFGKAVRSGCGIGPNAAPEVNAAPANAAPGANTGKEQCVENGYLRQRASWTARLSGPALQEAQRPIEAQIALQHSLQQLGLLPPNEPVDGVYGAKTRMAIVAFQQTMGLAPTGLIGDEDALALTRQTGQPAARSAWEQFKGDAAAMGLTVALAAKTAEGGACVATAQIRDPKALGNVTAESLRNSGAPQPGSDPAKLFAAEMEFLRTQFAARMVRAAYLAEPGVDQCRFETLAYTTDIYGRDQPQPLFSFTFDRATDLKIVWDRFDPTNLPKIAASFDYDAYARQRMHAAEITPEPQPPPAATPAPPSAPTSAPTPTSAPKRRRAAAKPETANLFGNTAPSDAAIAQWSGAASLTTRPFHADGAWELQWSSEGTFSARLHRVGAGEGRTVAFTTERASSSAYQPEGGDYYIEFLGTQPWTAAIAAVP